MRVDGDYCSRRPGFLPTAVAVVWSRTRLIGEFSEIMQAVEAWPGAAVLHGRSGLSFTLNGVEFGQLKWSGQLVLGREREALDAILAKKLARLDPELRDRDSVVFVIRNGTDVRRSLALLRRAYLIADSSQSNN